MSNLRFVTLKGKKAVGRVEKRNGRDHYVVPDIVALKQGVIHPVNAQAPEFVKMERLGSTHTKWEGQPLYAGHPMKDGAPIDGHLPEVLESAFGVTSNPRIVADELLLDAWIDIEKANAADSTRRVLARAQAGEPIEVSVGMYVAVLEAAGEYQGRAYVCEWMEAVPNHLAMLSETQVGACSIEMGCGALRAAGDKPGHEFHGNQYDDVNSLEAIEAAHAAKIAEAVRLSGAAHDITEARYGGLTSTNPIYEASRQAKGYSDAAKHWSRKHKTAGQKHEDAVTYHRQAAELHRKSGTRYDQGGAEAHDKAAEAHDRAAYSHHRMRYLSSGDTQTAMRAAGGPGSGFFGHSGRPGERGGSSAMATGRDAREAHDSARAHHEAAAAMHDAAAKFYRGAKSENDVTDMTKKAHQMSREAHDASQRSNSRPFSSEAAHASSNHARKASGVDSRAGYHEDAASKHRDAAYFHADTHAFLERSSRLKASEARPTFLTRVLQALNLRDAEMPNGMSARDMESELREALGVVEPTAEGIYVEDWFNDRVIYSMYGDGMAMPACICYMRAYTLGGDGEVLLEDKRTNVERVQSWEPVEPEDLKASSSGENQSEEKRLKAACGCGGTTTACTCGSHQEHATPTEQGDKDMKRTERIAALVANPHNPVKSVKALEAMTDDELAGVETSLKAAADKADADATALKTAQTAAAQPAQLTEEQFLAAAPQSFRDLIAAEKTRNETEHTALVASLKTAQSSFTEAELKGMSLDQLRKFGDAFKVARPAIDFSLQGVGAVVRTAEGAAYDYTPPDPYATKK